jgi:Ribbon-helix-helix protein
MLITLAFMAAPSMEQKTARLTVLIDPYKKKAFEELCAAQDLTPSQVVRKLIRQYLMDHGVTWRTQAKTTKVTTVA